MKILALLFALWCFNYTTANAQLTNGLIAHWEFSGNANDATNNGHNGTATNITYTTGKSGVNNTAAQFNGTSSFISIPYQSDMNVSNFSICALVKPQGYYSGLCQGNVIFSRGTEYQSGYYRLLMFDNAYDNHNCNIQDTSKNVFACGLGNFVSNNINLDYRYTPTVVTQNWYCVVTTFNGDTVRTYIDGQLKSTAVRKSGSLGTSTEGAAIGASRFGSYIQYPYWFNGIMDDLRIYNRALSASEISGFCALFDTTIFITGLSSNTVRCSDDTFSVAYNTVGSFLTGNTFIAELSDATGNFANPLFLGSVSATTAGTIACNTPANMPQGSNYRIRIRSTNPVRHSDLSQPITIHPNLTPSVTITANPNGPYTPGQYITFKATPIDAGSTPTYQWYRNGNMIIGATADSLYINTLNDGDSIHVIVYSSNKCPADLSAQSNKTGVAINTSVNTLQLENLALYPNPNSGSFRVTANNIKNDNIDITIINPLGQTVYKSTATKQNNNINHQIELNNVSAGIYILKLSAGDKQRNLRISIQ